MTSFAVESRRETVGEDVTNDIFACDFINMFVPAVANGTGAEEASPRTQAAPASPDDIPSTGPARDCERSSRAALKKWIADRHAKARKAIPLAPKLAAADAGRYEFSFRVVSVTEQDDSLYIDVPRATGASCSPKRRRSFS